MKSRFRKEYSKIKFDTVSLCDNVKMAKAKDEEAARERSQDKEALRKSVEKDP